jgi:hypothetical protein
MSCVDDDVFCFSPRSTEFVNLDDSYFFHFLVEAFKGDDVGQCYLSDCTDGLRIYDKSHRLFYSCTCVRFFTIASQLTKCYSIGIVEFLLSGLVR